MNTINALKLMSGISKANCLTCAIGHEEKEGPYQEIYWGLCCPEAEKVTDETYLEDAGIDPTLEKDCWLPDYLKCELPEYNPDSLDDIKESIDKFFEQVFEIAGPSCKQS